MNDRGSEAGGPGGPLRLIHRGEDALNLAILVALTLLPLVEIVIRQLGANVPGAVRWVTTLTLWIGFVGAVLATREGRHLSLSTGGALIPGGIQRKTRLFTFAVAAAVTAVLAYGAYVVVDAERESTEVLPPGVPLYVVLFIMPIGYGMIALRQIFAADRRWSRRLVALGLAVGLVALAATRSEEAAEVWWIPALVALLVATVLGTPIYVALGGLALVLFWSDAEPVAAVAAETVRQITSPVMPTIPLFTFTGYLLAESRASERLVRAFNAIFGSLPGGLAVMAAGVCAFFTTFTGASGVTILALGGLLYPALVAARYGERFSIGLLTASGSIGLLFFPSLPVILYGVVAKVPIDRMFIAGLVPGLVLVAAVSILGVRAGLKSEQPRRRFDLGEARGALWDAKYELFIPVVVAGGFFSRYTTLVETAALTAAYTFVVEVFVYRDLSLKRDLVRVARSCASLIGGVLIILGVAMGLTSYLVDADVPASALEWVRGGISSKILFLFVLNLFLLVVGCLMDIFSALVVVVPLILPVAHHFGVDPIHLGIIFLANLELGYLTPPVGMNLFLSSYRFEKPLTDVYRAAVPFLLILFFAVLVITYVPELTLAPVEWIFGDLLEAPPIKF